MAAEWYYQSSTGNDLGPFTPASLKGLAVGGHIGPATMVRKGKGGRWIQACKVKGLFDGERARATSTTPAPLSPLTTPVFGPSNPENEPQMDFPPAPYLPLKPKQGLSRALVIKAGVGGTLVVSLVAVVLLFSL